MLLLACLPSHAQESGAAPSASPVPPAAVPVPDVEDSRWTRTLERVASGVVTIQVDLARAFDTEWNMSSQATGFVVDAQRGLILTNRHVVTPGPVTATAVFLNREEVKLYPVYRDPVHDFGFYRYDPSKLRFIKPTELKLHPQGAQVGRESASLATTPANNFRFSPARSHAWIARRRTTASASTTTSTRFITRRPRAPRAARPARR